MHNPDAILFHGLAIRIEVKAIPASGKPVWRWRNRSPM
jgi:hypothetical protein